MLGMLTTEFGFWNAIIWVIVFMIVGLFAYLLRALGEKSYSKGTEQTKPFLSGTAEPSKEAAHVGAGNLYWGFMEALSRYYKPVEEGHTGIINDYIYWFVGTLAIMFIIIVGVF